MSTHEDTGRRVRFAHDDGKQDFEMLRLDGSVASAIVVGRPGPDRDALIGPVVDAAARAGVTVYGRVGPGPLWMAASPIAIAAAIESMLTTRAALAKQARGVLTAAPVLLVLDEIEPLIPGPDTAQRWARIATLVRQDPGAGLLIGAASLRYAPAEVIAEWPLASIVSLDPRVWVSPASGEPAAEPATTGGELAELRHDAAGGARRARSLWSTAGGWRGGPGLVLAEALVLGALAVGLALAYELAIVWSPWWLAGVGALGYAALDQLLGLPRYVQALAETAADRRTEQPRTNGAAR